MASPQLASKGGVLFDSSSYVFIGETSDSVLFGVSSLEVFLKHCFRDTRSLQESVDLSTKRASRTQL